MSRELGSWVAPAQVRPVRVGREPGQCWRLTDPYGELVWAARLGPTAALVARQLRPRPRQQRHLDRLRRCRRVLGTRPRCGLRATWPLCRCSLSPTCPPRTGPRAAPDGLQRRADGRRGAEAVRPLPAARGVRCRRWTLERRARAMTQPRVPRVSVAGPSSLAAAAGRPSWGARVGRPAIARRLGLAGQGGCAVGGGWPSLGVWIASLKPGGRVGETPSGRLFISHFRACTFAGSSSRNLRTRLLITQRGGES